MACVICPSKPLTFYQGWRGHVKGCQFILALRDHYVEKVAKHEHDDGDAAQTALEYIDFPRLGHILEVFDDDASGYVTVAEANKFTSWRPADWRYAPSHALFTMLIMVKRLLACQSGSRSGLSVSQP